MKENHIIPGIAFSRSRIAHQRGYFEPEFTELSPAARFGRRLKPPPFRPEGTHPSLGESLREKRLKLGLKQGDFAREIGISESYLSRIETGNIRKHLTNYSREIRY